MKKFFLFAIIAGLASCTPEIIPVLTDDLCGEWFIESGKTLDILHTYSEDTLLCTQSFTIISNGNVKQDNFYRSGIQQITQDSYYGNWSVSDSTLTINDWSGNIVKTGFRIASLTDKRMTLICNADTTNLWKKQVMLDEMPTTILGTWYETSLDSWAFTATGCRSSHKYEFVSTGASYKATYSSGSFIMSDKNYDDIKYYCDVLFINDMFLWFRKTKEDTQIYYLVSRDVNKTY